MVQMYSFFVCNINSLGRVYNLFVTFFAETQCIAHLPHTTPIENPTPRLQQYEACILFYYNAVSNTYTNLNFRVTNANPYPPRSETRGSAVHLQSFM